MPSRKELRAVSRDNQRKLTNEARGPLVHISRQEEFDTRKTSNKVARDSMKAHNAISMQRITDIVTAGRTRLAEKAEARSKVTSVAQHRSGNRGK